MATRILVLVGGVFLAVADGKALKWQVDDGSQSWTPARETFAVAGVLNNLGLGTAPLPTHAPELDDGSLELVKRVQGSDTCGYADGYQLSPVGCFYGSSCVVNSYYSAVGCCLGSLENCAVATACYSMGDRDILSLSNTDLSSVGYCSDALSLMTECLTYTYTGGVYDGFKGYACWTEATVIAVHESAEEFESSTRTRVVSDDPVPPAPPPTISFLPTTSSPVASEVGVVEKKSNAGAIAGGVVGGLAALAAIGFGVFLLLQKKKNQGGDHAAAAGMYTSPPPQQQQQQPQPPQQPPPQMQQHQSQIYQAQIYQAQPQYPPMQAVSPPGSPPPPAYMGNIANQNQPGFAPQMNDPKMGLQQSYYGPSVVSPTVSPPGSPPPQNQQPMGAISPAMGQQGWGGPTPPPQPMNGQLRGMNGAVEMPSGRGDGELRELA